MTATNVFAHIENVDQLMKNLLKILEKPYKNQEGMSEYQSPAPPSNQKYQTFCGT